MTTLVRDRYIVYEVLTQPNCSDFSLTINEIRDSCWRTYTLLYGLNGTSGAGLYFEEYDDEKKKGLIRCTSKNLLQLKVVLSLITKMKDKEIIIHPIFITGVINKAKKVLKT